MTSRLGVLTMTAALSAAALAGSSMLPSAAAAPSTDAFEAGWTVLAFSDATLGNAETEGSIAVGGNLRFTKGYPVVHSTGLTPTGYDLPRLDGTPLRVLVGGHFDAERSSGVSQVTSSGYATPEQIGQVRLGDVSNLAINGRGSSGLWMSAAGTSAGTEPALETTDVVNQSATSVAAPGAFARLLGDAQSKAVATAQAFASCTAHDVALAPGSHGGARSLTLAPGTNVLTVKAADLGDFRIELAGATLGAEASLVVNVTDLDGTVTIPGFAAAADTSAAKPNVVAPWVVWNFGTATEVSLTGSKVSGSVLAPMADLRLDANSPIEGQIIGDDITSTGGEFHHYGLAATFDCAPTTEPTAEPTNQPTTDPTTGPTTDPTTDPTNQPTSDPTASVTTPGAVAGESESSEVAGESESNGTAAQAKGGEAGNGILPDTGAPAAMLLGLGALALLGIGGAVVIASRRAPRH